MRGFRPQWRGRWTQQRMAGEFWRNSGCEVESEVGARDPHDLPGGSACFCTQPLPLPLCLISFQGLTFLLLVTQNQEMITKKKKKSLS